jgi:hypothetical protein
MKHQHLSHGVQMVRATLAIALSIVLVNTLSAAITTTVTSAPTVGIAGYDTYTITATAAVGEKIIGFDFAGGTYGIAGAMHQLNPAGNSTVFADRNFDGFLQIEVSQDSQFKVLTWHGTATNASESADLLKGTFTYNAANIATRATDVWSFVQIATNNPTAVNYFGTLTVLDSAGQSRLETIQGSLVPEPALSSLLALAISSLFCIRRY